MKSIFKTLIFSGLLALCLPMFAQWKPAGDKIKTIWADQLDPENVLVEYSR